MQQATGNRDLDLVREAEEGDTVLGRHSHRGVGPLHRNEYDHFKRTGGAKGDRSIWHFSDVQKW